MEKTSQVICLRDNWSLLCHLSPCSSTHPPMRAMCMCTSPCARSRLCVCVCSCACVSLSQQGCRWVHLLGPSQFISLHQAACVSATAPRERCIPIKAKALIAKASFVNHLAGIDFLPHTSSAPCCKHHTAFRGRSKLAYVVQGQKGKRNHAFVRANSFTICSVLWGLCYTR